MIWIIIAVAIFFFLFGVEVGKDMVIDEFKRAVADHYLQNDSKTRDVITKIKK